MSSSPQAQQSQVWDGTALLVIDVQQGLFKRPTPVYEAERLLENINLLADRAHQAGIPVFYVQHANKAALPEGSDDWQLHPQIRPLSTDVVIHKRQGSAFKKTPLKKELESRHVTRVVIAGLVTHGCVRATCLDAKRLGYDVILVKDAHSNFHERAGEIIDEWNQKLSEGTVELRATQEIDFREG